MKTKKTAHKKQIKIQKPLVRIRISYLILGVMLVGIFSFGIINSSPYAVLGASTSTVEQQGFSFGNFFSSIFSFFTEPFHLSGSTTSSNSNNSNSDSGFGGNPNIKTTNNTQVSLTQEQLLAIAGDKYASGNLPLGDNKYTTTGPKKGYIYLCNVPQNGGGGAQSSGSWLGTTTWTLNGKPTVEGHISWSNAKFSDTLSGDLRVLSGNGLPVGMTTGIFPISSTDPAYKYDRNPNSIRSQSISLNLPSDPSYSDTPNCMGMEVGVMTNGVPLFNGFDAEMRDAAAHEVQDSCDGHPQSGGEYHYHSLSRCFTDTSVQKVIGFALDGFPITGPVVGNNKYLTTDDLDECHGITSQIVLDNKTVTMYHYVMTQDFPYSVSCFRGKPVSLQIISSGRGQGGQGGQTEAGQTGQNNTMHPQPPQEAYTACSGKTSGTSCSFTAPRGKVIGTCQTPSGQTTMLCVPTAPEQNQGNSLPQNY